MQLSRSIGAKPPRRRHAPKCGLPGPAVTGHAGHAVRWMDHALRRYVRYAGTSATPLRPLRRYVPCPDAAGEDLWVDE
ncbi:hypothetical protein [Kribbella catacumbae]|uniref:hypothetical protein n=1 Tax=Kribbella catacumbae TaxID=460086 RepID=UPI0012FA67F8|nr:hypothetical protein [Kribbella catacumbae]